MKLGIFKWRRIVRVGTLQASLIAISSVALLAVLIIQVNWILQTAKIKEELFNEKANMVLSKTAEALGSDKETCRKIGTYVEMSNPTEQAAKLGSNEVQKIDSLFTYYMGVYGIHIEYYFEVIKPGSDSPNKTGAVNYIYVKPLEETSGKSWLQLKLIFPEKSQFIIAEMGVMFITSVILILVVLFLFWRTILSLMKEKEISEHTSDFLNNMTHEFKTPLTNIALAGKMITKDPAAMPGDKIKHYSGIILQENEKLRLQVEQVLSMTALERGEIPLQKTELDFHELVRDALKCIGIQIENRQGQLKLSLEAEQFRVIGDKTHLTNVLCNLLDNAVKYSKGVPEFSLRTANAGQNLLVEISDKGIGIDKRFHKKVFDKFFRVPTGDVHDVKGFGLGLAYIKKIVELHGGSIDVQSEKGEGTTFRIILPHA